jgi:hypothetical protein
LATESGAAVFRAIADFSRLRREAKTTRKDLKSLGDETARTGRKVGDTEQSTTRAGNAFGRLVGRLREMRRESRAAQQEMQGTGDAADRTGRKIGEAGRLTDRAGNAFGRLVGRIAAMRQEARAAEQDLQGTGDAAGDAGKKIGGTEAGIDRAGNALTRLVGRLAAVRREAPATGGALDGVGASATAAGQRIGAAEQGTDRAGNAFTRLMGRAARLQRELDGFRRSRAGRELNRITDAAAGMLRTLGGIGARIGGLSLIATLSTAAVAPVLGLVAALTTLAGALGVIPALVAAGGVAVGTLALGLIGLKDAFEDTGGAASSMASAQRAAERAAITGAEQIRAARQRLTDAHAAGARRVADAERAVARAQQDARDAQENLNRAREEAAEQLEDLHLALRGGALDERAATIALTRAQQRLAEARAEGATGLELEEAILGVEEAQLALDEARERYGDLAKESAAASKAGVDGADSVVEAQRRVAESLAGVVDAQDDLAQTRVDAARDVADAERDLAAAIRDAAWAQEDAAQSIASAAGKAAPELSRSAQQFVDAVKSLEPEFNGLRLDVQERLFSGLGTRVTELAERYLPMLRGELGETATTFNSMAHRFADFMAQRSTVDDFGTSLDNINAFWANTVDAIQPATQAALDFVTVGTELLPEMGTELTDLTRRMAEFVREARESGELEQWMRDGVDQVKALGKALKNVARIFAAVARASNAEGAGLFHTLAELTDRLADFLESAEGQEALTKLFGAVGDAVDVLLPILKALVTTGADIAQVLVRIAERLGPGVVAVIEGLGKAFDEAEPDLLDLAEALGDFLTALGDAGPLIGELASGVANVLTPAVQALTALLELLTSWFNSLPEPVQDVIGGVAGLGIAALAFLVIGGKMIKFFTDLSGGIKDSIDWLKKWRKEAKDTATDPDLDLDGKKKSGGSKPGSKPGGNGVDVPVIVDADAARKSGEKAGTAAAEGVGKGAKSGWSKALGAAGKLFGFIGVALMVDEAAGGDPASEIEQMFRDAKTTLDEEVAIWQQTFDGAMTWLEQQGTAMAAVWSVGETLVSEKLSSFGTKFAEFWTGAAEETALRSGEIGANIDGWLTGVGIVWDEKWRKTKDTVSNAWQEIKGFSSDGATGTTDHVNTILDALGPEWSSKWGEAYETVRDWASDIGDAIGDGVDTAIRKLGELTRALGSVSGPSPSRIVDIARWFAGFFNRGGKVPGGGPNRDDRMIAVTGGEWVVDRDNTKRYEPLLRAISAGQGERVMHTAMALGADELMANAAGARIVPAKMAAASALAPATSMRHTVASAGDPSIGEVHVTQVVHNPLPEKPSVTASKRMGSAARHGLGQALGRAS